MDDKQSQVADEMKKMEWEPLLPVEKKLILWSLCIGVISLALLVWISHAFFPAH